MLNPVTIFRTSFSRFAKFAAEKIAPGGIPMGEVATRARAVSFSSWMNQLPNPDPILKAKGIDISAYRDLMSDGSLAGAITSRKAALLGMEWGLNRAKSLSRSAKLVETHLRTLNHNDIRAEMFQGALFGYAPMEIEWAAYSGVWLPKSITGKPQEWFCYDDSNQLRFKSRDNWQGEPVPDKKFLCPRKDASYANPYGIADLSRCFWPVIFKRNGYSFWVRFSERYGMPWVLGKLPRGLAPTEYDALADRLDSMVQDAIAVVPNDADVTLVGAGDKGGSVEIYSKLIEFCKAEMSVVIRGHEGATNSTAGKLGGADTATKVMDEIRDGDASMCIAAYNQLLRWIWEINWPSEREIPTFDIWEKKDVDKALADRDAVLSEKLGVKFTKEYVAEAYDLAPEHFEVEAKPVSQEVEPGKPAAPPSMPKEEPKKKLRFAQFAALQDQADILDDAAAAIEPEKMQALMDSLLKPVWGVLQQGTTSEELEHLLVEAYPKMDDTELRTLLTQALFVADIVGGLTAKKSPKV